MKKVRHILDTKGNSVYFLNPESTVYDALKIMLDKNVGALLVIENDFPTGIISERDYARKVALAGKATKETLVKDIMTTKLITVSPDDNIDFCMNLMSYKHIRHLPVLENNKLVGLISIGDVVKYIMEDQKSTIDQLENYISGTIH